jgi:hypothetical protein
MPSHAMYPGGRATLSWSSPYGNGVQNHFPSAAARPISLYSNWSPWSA